MNKELIEIIAGNLIYYRKKAGLTQLDLAEKLNYSDKSISKWERKESLPDIEVLYEIAKIYGLTVNDFLTVKKKEKIYNKYYSKVLITLLAFAGVEIIATIVFAMLNFFQVWDKSWLVFIYSIPVLSIVSIIFNDVFFKRIYNLISTSILIWGIALSIFLSVNFANKYMLFIIAIPINVFFFLLYPLLHKIKINKEREKNENEN